MNTETNMNWLVARVENMESLIVTHEMNLLQQEIESLKQSREDLSSDNKKCAEYLDHKIALAEEELRKHEQAAARSE